MADDASAAVAVPRRRGLLRAFASALALITLTHFFALGAACLVWGLSCWSYLIAAALALFSLGLVRFDC